MTPKETAFEQRGVEIIELSKQVSQLQKENEELKKYILTKVNLLGRLYADVQFNQKVMILDIKKIIKENKPKTGDEK